MSKRAWSKTFGDRGCRVRVYEARPGGPLMRSIFINGRENRRSLGHRDKELAKRQAYELIAQMVAENEAVEAGTITLGTLVHCYVESPSFSAKKPRTQAEDRRKLERLVQFFGAHRRASHLTDSDVHQFIAARRRGDAVPGGTPGRGVRDRAIQADLVALMVALNWATKARDKRGQRLLTENPLRGVSIPREKNPRRPLMAHATFEKLLEVAPQVGPALPVFIIIAEATGRRLSAIRQLRWSDVDLDRCSIRWRAATDKKGYEAELPISEIVRGALRGWRSMSGGIGEAWVFPAAKDPSRPVDRHLVDEWLRRAYVLAKIERQPGGLWHPFRRKFATERKGHAPIDVAAAGGWRDLRTVLNVYQQADPESVRTTLLSPTHRVGTVQLETHNGTHNT